jgi:drug/metabolite transporter (DMT)-like permease
MKRSTSFLLMVLHVACAAGTYVFSKLATDGFPSPAALTLARALLATLLLLALTGTLIPKPDFDGPTWLKLFGLGILQVPINQYLFLRGLKSTAPSHAALLYALTPLIVLLLSAARARQWPPRRMVTGVVVALAGAVVVLRPWERSDAARATRIGDLWILAAVVSWAIYTVAVRDLCLRHDPRVVAGWNLILGSLAMMPFAAAALKEVDVHRVATSAWLGLIWMAAVTSVVMNLLWSQLLRHLQPVQVTICMNAQPPATALLQFALQAQPLLFGVTFNAEPLGARFFAGMALVLGGVVLVNWRRGPQVEVGAAKSVVPVEGREVEPSAVQRGQ